MAHPTSKTALTLNEGAKKQQSKHRSFSESAQNPIFNMNKTSEMPKSSDQAVAEETLSNYKNFLLP